MHHQAHTITKIRCCRLARATSITKPAVYLAKLLLCYLFKDYPGAIENARAAEKSTGFALPLMSFGEYTFYYSLALLAMYPHVETTEQQEYMAVVTQNQKRMQRWVDRCSANYQHKYDLVEAEINRVLGNTVKAMSDYDCPRGTAKGDRAKPCGGFRIAGAKAQEYVQEEALGNELAAKFYPELGKEKIASVYMSDAHYCYTLWGATRKVENLEEEYPQFFTRTTKGATTSRRTLTTNDTSNL
jgi:hypothetical protein